MEEVVLKAIMERYGGLTVLYQAMREDQDTVLVNLEDDVDYKYDTDEILGMIEKTY